MMDANGLVYLRARYYDPGLGVFPSLDPLENMNLYAYVRGNPTNWTDPTGLQDENCWYGCFSDPCTYTASGGYQGCGCAVDSPERNGGFLNAKFFECVNNCVEYYGENYFYGTDFRAAGSTAVAVALADSPAPGGADIAAPLVLLAILAFSANVGPSPLRRSLEADEVGPGRPVPPIWPDPSELLNRIPWDSLMKLCGDAVEKLIRIIARTDIRTGEGNGGDEDEGCDPEAFRRWWLEFHEVPGGTSGPNYRYEQDNCRGGTGSDLGNYPRDVQYGGVKIEVDGIDPYTCRLLECKHSSTPDRPKLREGGFPPAMTEFQGQLRRYGIMINTVLPGVRPLGLEVRTNSEITRDYAESLFLDYQLLVGVNAWAISME